MLSNNSTGSIATSRKAILSISAHSVYHDSLQSIFRGSRWRLHRARTASDGLKAIRRTHREISVVICEHSLPDGDWRLLLAEMGTAGIRSSLIVSSRLADERLWAEVLNLGAFDLLLGAPFEPEEVLRVTEGAWSAWHRAALPRIGPGSARRLAGCVPTALAVGA